VEDSQIFYVVEEDSKEVYCNNTTAENDMGRGVDRNNIAKPASMHKSAV